MEIVAFLQLREYPSPIFLSFFLLPYFPLYTSHPEKNFLLLLKKYGFQLTPFSDSCVIRETKVEKKEKKTEKSIFLCAIYEICGRQISGKEKRVPLNA